jgi:hypothetical protein
VRKRDVQRGGAAFVADVRECRLLVEHLPDGVASAGSASGEEALLHGPSAPLDLLLERPPGRETMVTRDGELGVGELRVGTAGAQLAQAFLGELLQELEGRRSGSSDRDIG